MTPSDSFAPLEASIASIHAAFAEGRLTASALTRHYLKRIEAYDHKGPAINALICQDPSALETAEQLDQACRRNGPVGPLHGIPLVMKDQGDVRGLPTTLGSVLFKDHRPDRDAFVVARLRRAGAIFLGKSTLGELGAGDTHGSLFGSTRNPYDLARTAGGSSGGSAACVSANFAAAAVAQEGFASIRRPAAWNAVVGMRPTAGLVSRTGVFAGWPSVHGSLGPMARTVADAARLLDVMAGYDPDDPLTARGVGHIPPSYLDGLDAGALRGARIGILRESMGYDAEPESEDFAKVGEVFERALAELRRAGAELVDPVVIPDLRALLARRAPDLAEDEASFAEYFRGSSTARFATRQEAVASPDFARVLIGSRRRWTRAADPVAHYEYLKAREALMTVLLKVMADARLDAIVHKSVEHQPTLIADGVNPPFVDQKGAPHLNTFLVYVPSITVPAGFTRDRLPAGITFLGRPYDDARMIRYAHAFEQTGPHRRPPASTPPLAERPDRD